MSGARQTILDRLVAGPVAGAGLHPDRYPVPAVVPPATVESSTLVERFTGALDKLSVTWEIAESPVTARLQLASRLKAEGVQRLLSWSANDLPVAGVLEALDVLGVPAITPDLRAQPLKLRPQDPAMRDELLARIETAEVGLTGADAAIAATGTLLLGHGPGRPMLVSQLPRRHLVLLPLSRLEPTLETWLAGQRRADRPVLRLGHMTALTGVTRSRDIELHPALGVHGPRQLHVIVVQGL